MARILLAFLLQIPASVSFTPIPPRHTVVTSERRTERVCRQSAEKIWPLTAPPLRMSDWSDFAVLDDDDDLYGSDDEEIGFADENDSQEMKAEVGSLLEAPEVDWDGEPIFLPVGTYCRMPPNLSTTKRRPSLTV